MIDIIVEVAYAQPAKQSLLTVNVPEGSSVLAAIEKSTILKMYKEIDLDRNKVGVFGKVVKNIKQHILKPKDRVEIYRPLSTVHKG